MPKVPPAILFDMDDTLISFNGVGGRAWEICCRKFIEAHDFQIPLDTFMERIKKTGEWYWDDPDRHKKGRADLPKARREMVGIALRELDVRDVSLSNELADAYSRCRTELIYVFPSSKATLETLVGQGVRLGLITNGTSAEQVKRSTAFRLKNTLKLY